MLDYLAEQYLALVEPYDMYGLSEPLQKPEIQEVKRSYAKARHRCGLCKRQFRRKGELDDHINTHTGNRRESLFKIIAKFYVSDTHSTVLLAHACPYCPVSFAARSNLWRHKKSLHSNQFHSTDLASNLKNMVVESTSERSGLFPILESHTTFEFGYSDPHLFGA